jgi:hypothetical protein
MILGLITGVGLVLLVPLVLKSTKELAITIDGLKHTYSPGDSITFTVNAEGLLEKQCNYHTAPAIFMQRISDNKVIYSNREPYLATSCDPHSSYISSHWTYPMRRDNELYGINSQNETIAISQPGSYLVSAFFDKANVTKQFSVVMDN